MNKFKLIAFIILLTFTIQASAFGFLLPLLFGVAETGSAAGAGAVTAAEFLAVTGARVGMKTALESSLAIHGGVAAITFGTASVLSSQSATSPAPLQILLDPNKPLITPPNWTQAVTGKIQPTPSQTISQSLRYSVIQGETSLDYSSETQDGACKIQGNLIQPSGGTNNFTYNNSTSRCTGNTYNSDGSIAGSTNSSVYSSLGCPLGYGEQSGQCTLINALLVQKPSDNVCQLTTNLTSITPDPTDPDCKIPDLLAQGIDATNPQKLVLTNPNKTDQHIVKIYSEHIVELEHLYKDSSGNTVHDKIQIDPNPPPNQPTITGTSHTVNQGTGTLEQLAPQSGQTPTFDKSGLATSTGQEIQLNETKNSNTKLDKLNSNFDCTGLDCINQTDSSKQQIDASTAEITAQITEHGNSLQQNEGLFTGLWQPAFEKTECIPLQKNIMNKNIVIDQCPTVSFIQKLLTWLFNLFGLWFVLTRLFVKG